jgi:hypothetical protein
MAQLFRVLPFSHSLTAYSLNTCRRRCIKRSGPRGRSPALTPNAAEGAAGHGSLRLMPNLSKS